MVHRATGAAVAAALIAGFAASSARADITGNPLVVTASTSTGLSSTWVLLPTMGQTVGDDWHFQSSATWSYQFWDQGQFLGSINSLSVHLYGDPQVHVNFSTFAGAADTNFTFSSALVGFPSITGGTANASAGLTVADMNGNGVVLAGNNPGGFAYRADFNGMVPGGSNFASFFPGLADPAGNSVNAFIPPTVVPASVVNMSAQFAFTLSANDLASGTSSFEIVPSPAGAVVLGLGLCAVGRRRRS
jgi:hypothetical protein